MRRLAVLMVLIPVVASADEPAPRPAAKPADVETIDSILAALYDVISGPKGQPRDFDRLRSLFAPGARLVPVVTPREGTPEAKPLTVEEFIELAGPALEDGFFESEIARTTQRFGNMAHVFSTYESRRARDEAPFTRGINSIQLLHDGDRWWVVTIYWQNETKGQPIPDEFLPK
jgi:hypothetical protein